MGDIIDNIDDELNEEDIDFNTDDDELLDITIEITIDESDIILTDSETLLDEEVSTHKQDGKHSLKYDSIFKGKKDDDNYEESDITDGYFNETFELDKTSSFYFETRDNESYLREKRVKEKVYDVLTTKTKLNLLNNRRKPSKIDFNSYYSILKRELVNERFSNVELFNELSVYFSDNLFNMFKLLDNRWRNVIIEELHEHIGKNTQSKDIMNRNIYEGTEVEFKHIDILDEIKYFTGVVIEVDYNNSMFKIDSFENVYNISINDITKILNNTKFKHNLNKLDNIDFL
jgi:hypothetical protein